MNTERLKKVENVHYTSKYPGIESLGKMMTIEEINYTPLT